MTTDVVVLDETFRALADPSRRTMLTRLSAGRLSVSELAQPLDMSLSAVVQHVQVLEACGLVRTSKTGRTRTCELRAERLRTAESWLSDRRALWGTRLDRLDDLLGGK